MDTDVAVYATLSGAVVLYVAWMLWQRAQTRKRLQKRAEAERARRAWLEKEAEDERIRIREVINRAPTHTAKVSHATVPRSTERRKPKSYSTTDRRVQHSSDDDFPSTLPSYSSRMSSLDDTDNRSFKGMGGVAVGAGASGDWGSSCSSSSSSDSGGSSSSDSGGGSCGGGD